MTSSKQPSHLRAGLVVFFLAISLLVPLISLLALGLPSLPWVFRTQRSAILNSLIWAIGTFGGVGVGSLAVAYLAFERPRLQRLLIVTVLPVAMGASAVAVVWRLAFAFHPSYRPQVGVVNYVFTSLGLPSVSWITQEPLVNTVVLGSAMVWLGAGLAGWWLCSVISHLPAEWLTTARRYGASKPQRFRFVAWPWIKRPLITAVTLAVLVSLNAHTLVQVATSGSFGTALIEVNAWGRLFADQQSGRGLAMALVALLASGVVGAVGWILWQKSVPVAPKLSNLRRGGRRSAPPASADLPDNQLSWRLLSIVEVIVLVAFVLITLLPIIGMLVTAFTPADVIRDGGWWTNRGSFTLHNLQDSLAGLDQSRGLWPAFVSSLVITVPVVVALVALGRYVAPWLISLSTRLRRFVVALLVAAVFIPTSAVLFPVEAILRTLSLLGTYPAAWMSEVVVFAPLAIAASYFFARNSGERLIGFVAPALVVFIAVWNDYTVALTALGNKGSQHWPLPLELARHVGIYGETQAPLAAGALVAAIVPMVIALVFGAPLMRAISRHETVIPPDELSLKSQYDQPYDGRGEQLRL